MASGNANTEAPLRAEKDKFKSIFFSLWECMDIIGPD
jgi:hypothetical protein